MDLVSQHLPTAFHQKGTYTAIKLIPAFKNFFNFSHTVIIFHIFNIINLATDTVPVLLCPIWQSNWKPELVLSKE